MRSAFLPCFFQVHILDLTFFMGHKLTHVFKTRILSADWLVAYLDSNNDKCCSLLGWGIWTNLIVSNLSLDKRKPNISYTLAKKWSPRKTVWFRQPGWPVWRNWFTFENAKSNGCSSTLQFHRFCKGNLLRGIIKVHIFCEGHKILRNLHRIFDRYYIGQIYCGNFSKISSILRIYELY